MKKVIILACLAFAFQISTAQIQFGVKGGINYNSDSFKNVKDDVFSGAKGNAGYHAGLWFRGKIPVIGIYLRPEVIYTNVENDLTYTAHGTTINTATTFKLQKIDLPILVGKKIFGIGNIFAGPSFQYILNSDFGLAHIKEVDISKLSLGLQFGGGVEFGKLGIDIRWERSLSNSELNFVDNNISENITFDNRSNQIIIGLSYRL